MNAELNSLLTRVGPGTAMGHLLRNYWIPAVTSSSLTRDEHPLRIRLLGEDLLAFRDTHGEVGIVSADCPHRGAPLYYGRNEEGGLRCVYHGWKFDVRGTCVDMPTEEAGCRMMRNIRLPAYQVLEKNGVVWVWMGAAGQAPELPAFEWNALPAEHCHISLRVQECSWVQALEGSIDSAHAAILHGRIDIGGTSVLSKSTMLSRVKHPKTEVIDTKAGVAIATLRQLDDLCYWRVSQFMLPFYTFPAPFEDSLSGQAWVPIDDENTLNFMVTFDPVKPLTEKARRIYSEGYKGRDSGHPSPNGLERRVGQPYERYWPKYSRHNDFGVDWEEQRTRRFSGMPGLWVQDAAVQSGLLPIVDRSRQHLGTTDVGIVRVHKRLIDAAQKLRDESILPRGARSGDTFAIRGFAVNLAPGESWKQSFDTLAQPGAPVLVSAPPEVEAG